MILCKYSHGRPSVRHTHTKHAYVSVVNNLPPPDDMPHTRWASTRTCCVGTQYCLLWYTMLLGVAESHYLRISHARWNCFADQGFCRMWMATPPPIPLRGKGSGRQW